MTEPNQVATPTDTQATPPAAPAPEPVAAQPVVEPPRASRALRELMEKENHIRKEAESLKAQKAEIEQARELQRLLKEDPLAFFEKSDVSYDDITKKIVEGVRPNPTAKLEEEIAQLREKVTRRDEEEYEVSKQQAIDEAKDAVKTYVETAQDFPLVKALGAHNVVFQAMFDEFQQTGNMPDEKAVASKVEQYFSNIVDTLSKVESVRQRLMPTQVTTPAEVTKQTAATVTTLTNNMAGQAPTRLDDSTEVLDYEASLKKAAALLRFNK